MNYSPIRIGMVLDQSFPPDARVEREAVALIEAGFEVHLLCTVPEASGQPDKLRHLHRGIHLHYVEPKQVTFRIPGLGLKTRFPYRGLIKNLNRSLWNIDTTWHTLIHRFVVDNRLQGLHIHDLRLVSTGLSISEKYGIPLVADLHENYPALMEMFKGKQNPKRGMAQRKKWDTLQKDCSTRAHRIITVSQEMKDILVGQGIPAEKITVIPNTVEIEKFQNFPVDTDLIDRYRNTFMLTYVGHINNTHRGIHTLLEAVALLKDKIPNLLFVGAGGYRDAYMAELQEIIETHQLHPYVEFTGWLDESQFVSYIQASQVCICPHIANDQTNTGIPNKVYLYHLFGKSLIGSSFVPMKRYIEETGGGLCFESGNPQDLAASILRLYEDQTLKESLAHQGQQAVLNIYNWTVTAKELVSLYQGLYRNAFEKELSQVPSLL